ncbi:hypothetical protein Agub_g13516, partial [Astrephomene gubernaculifera]
ITPWIDHEEGFTPYLTQHGRQMALDAPSLDSIFELLGDPKHLQREKGLRALVAFLQGLSGTEDAAVESGISELLSQEPWEKKLGGLMGAKAYVSTCQPQESYLERLRLAAMGLLEDGEVRVRLAVGDCLQALARLQGVCVFEACLPAVLDSIRRNFDRSEDADDGAAEGPDGQRLATAPMARFVTESPALGSPVERPSSPVRGERQGEGQGQGEEQGKEG